MPIMSELKGKYYEFEAVDVAPSSIAFKDKQREKQRIDNFETRVERAQVLWHFCPFVFTIRAFLSLAG